VGVTNIMLVSVEERVREIGLRRALGAKKSHIRWQFLLEALVMTVAAGVIGMLLSAAITSAIGTLPFLGPAYEDDSGKVDIHLTLSFVTMTLSTAILVVVGVISGWLPPCKPPNSTRRSPPLRVIRHDKDYAETRSSLQKMKPEEANEHFSASALRSLRLCVRFFLEFRS